MHVPDVSLDVTHPILYLTGYITEGHICGLEAAQQADLPPNQFAAFVVMAEQECYW